MSTTLLLSNKPRANDKMFLSLEPSGSFTVKYADMFLRASSGVPWWGDHNLVKHSRSDSYSLDTLENCICSMASLCVIELYLSKVALGSVDEIGKISCEYFDHRYGIARLVGPTGKKLPDFL